MRRVAVFGNAGGGKSTLSAKLARLTGLPLHVIDVMQYRDGRYRPNCVHKGKLPLDDYLDLNRKLLSRDSWIIDGFDTEALAWERFAAADTLVYVDLSLAAHYGGVTRRLLAGLFRNPRGWPDDSPVWESTLSSYRVIGLCHRHLTPKYRRLVADAAMHKSVYHLRSRAEIAAFLYAVGRTHRA